jgi:Na+/melibiose symporter-like transporter
LRSIEGDGISRAIPLSQKLIYALGQFGWSLAAYGAQNLVAYFYLPPELEAGSVFPTFVFEGALLGFVTLVGLANAVGRVVDAFADPAIAAASDRAQSRMGRRRAFMAIGIGPLVVFSFLVFVPLQPDTAAVNAVWLIGSLTLFHIAMTFYVVPYTALLSELGNTTSERLELSTYISVTWAMGFVLGNQAYALQGFFEQRMEAVPAFQSAILLFAAIAGVCMLVPVLFLRERRYARPQPTSQDPREAFRALLANRNYRIFISADLLYWMAFAFVQSGISYYATVLLGLETEMVSVLLTALFAMSVLFYVPVNILARRVGKKRILVVAFIVFALVFLILLVGGRSIAPPNPTGYLVLILAAFPISAYGILPNAIVGDMAEANGLLTGRYEAGLFFGARMFVNKLGISLANLIFPSLLLLGRSIENPAGIRLSGAAALIFCLAGLAVFLRFNESSVLATLAGRERDRGERDRE